MLETTYATPQQAQTGHATTGFALSKLDEVLVALHEAQVSAAGHTITNHDAMVSAVEGSLRLHLSEGERGLLTDILLNLLRQAELDLREALSARLGGMVEVPERMVLAMAHDTISVARPVLEHSPVLSAEDLLYIIQSKGSEYWQSIARRKALQEEIVMQLAHKNDVPTSEILIHNADVKLPTSAIRCFAKICRDNDALAEPLLNRPEIDRKLAMELYWHVGHRLRAHITNCYKVDQKIIDDALQESLQDMMNTDRPTLDSPAPYRPTGLMVEVAKNYQSIGKITDTILLQTLRRNQLRFFIALFSAKTNLAHDTTYSLMRQTGGQGLAIAAKASGVAKESFVSLFLLSRSITRGESSVNPAELQKAIKYYDTITVAMAEQILNKSGGVV